jgi:hypothetical protein
MRRAAFAVAPPLSAASSAACVTCRQRRAGVVACAPAPAGGPPAAVLLGASSVLAIATIGCVFELSSGHPEVRLVPFLPLRALGLGTLPC